MTAAQFKIKRKITFPLSKWKNGETKYLKFDGTIYQGRQLENAPKDDKGRNKDPAHLAVVTDLESGEQVQIILGKVLRTTLIEEYPDETYLGRGFAITQNRIPGQDYNVYEIAELDLS